ncbi:MAG: hypothetical protein M1480_13720 [Bacteroidetes bacterium]|nr:hypothetical protein [Bacteroidota bacterium]
MKLRQYLTFDVGGGVGDNGGVNGAVKERLKIELVYIILNSGISLVEIIEKFRLAKRTAERDMKLLRNLEFVIFEGAPKTGRYIAKDKTKKQELRRS